MAIDRTYTIEASIKHHNILTWNPQGIGNEVNQRTPGDWISKQTSRDWDTPSSKLKTKRANDKEL